MTVDKLSFSPNVILFCVRALGRLISFIIVFLILEYTDTNTAADWVIEWSLFRILYPLYTFGFDVFYFSSRGQNFEITKYFNNYILLGFIPLIFSYVFDLTGILEIKLFTVVLSNFLVGYIRLIGAFQRKKFPIKSISIEDLLPSTILFISTYLFLSHGINFFWSLSAISLSCIIILFGKNLVKHFKYPSLSVELLDSLNIVILSFIFTGLNFLNRFFIDKNLDDDLLIKFQLLFQIFQIYPVLNQSLNVVIARDFDQSSWEKQYNKKSNFLYLIGGSLLIITQIFLEQLSSYTGLNPSYINVFYLFIVLSLPLYNSLMFLHLLNKSNLSIFPAIALLLISTLIYSLNTFESITNFILLHPLTIWIFYLICFVRLKPSLKLCVRLFKKFVILSLMLLLLYLLNL